MKNFMAYVAVYAMAFIITSYGIIYFNGVYRNIFAFDFTPIGIKTYVTVPTIKPINREEVKNYLWRKIEPELKNKIDGIKIPRVVDTVYKHILLDERVLDSIKILREELISLEKSVKSSQIQMQKKKRSQNNSKSAAPSEKTKQTAKLLESMSPQKAAKVLANYSDNKAREILISMSKKKAAKLMDNLEPQVIARIMSSKS